MFGRRGRVRNHDHIGRAQSFLSRFSLSKTKITIGLLLIFGLLIGYSIFLSDLFKLRVIEFQPETISCVEKKQITDLLPKDQNLLFIKAEELGGMIRAKYPCLEHVNVQKQFPETLVISIAERRMAALLRAGVKPPEVVQVEVIEASPSSESAKVVPPPKDDFKVDESEYPTLYSVDRKGFILAKDPYVTEEFPIFYYLTDHQLQANHWLQDGVIESALTLTAKIKELGLDVISYRIEGTSLYLDGPQRIIFLLEKDPTAQVIPLQLILQKAKMDEAVIEKIDLRFDKPVVVYGRKR